MHGYKISQLNLIKFHILNIVEKYFKQTKKYAFIVQFPFIPLVWDQTIFLDAYFCNNPC